MNRVNGTMVEYKDRGSGNPHRHNFVNRYLPDEELRKPTQEISSAISSATQKQLDRIVGAKTQPAKASSLQTSNASEAQFIKYTPKQQGDGHNSSASQRIIKMHEVQVDPLELAKFKHKRIPGGPGSPPKTIMHSPPRKLTVKDQQDWKIPPCISNWKNAKGYTIPLEMRLSADGRTLQQHTINEKHAKLANAFYIAEKQARKEIEERNKIQKTMAYKDFLKQEEKMREAAALARSEKNKILETTLEERDAEEAVAGGRRKPSLTEEEEEAKKERDTFRYINRREQERERRLDVARNKKSKTARDAERDISEKIALGQAQPTMSKESMYDQRLFNQTSGLDSGFGDEDEYNAFDKPLFADKTATSIYNVKEYDDNIDEEGDGKGNVEKMLTRAPNRGFDGAAADKKSGRSKPVEFEKHSDDTFNLESFITDNKKR